jgi:cell division protein FtsB
MSLRKALFPAICLGLLGYFTYHLIVGDHGMDSHAQLQTQLKTVEGELKGLQAVRERLDRDVALMRADKLDPDMLDERARTILNFSHPNDIVIMDKPSTSTPKR